MSTAARGSTRSSCRAIIAAGSSSDGSVTGIERISMLAGTNIAFGDPGTNLYDYVLTTARRQFRGRPAGAHQRRRPARGRGLHLRRLGRNGREVRRLRRPGHRRSDRRGAASISSSSPRAAASPPATRSMAAAAMTASSCAAITRSTSPRPVMPAPSPISRTSRSPGRPTNATPAAAAPSSITASPGTAICSPSTR